MQSYNSELQSRCACCTTTCCCGAGCWVTTGGVRRWIHRLPWGIRLSHGWYSGWEIHYLGSERKSYFKKINDIKETWRFDGSMSSLGSLSSFGSEPFSLLICLNATKFVLLSVFSIWPKICSKSRLKSTKKSTSGWRTLLKQIGALSSLLPKDENRN